MGSIGFGTKNDRAVKDQQQFTVPTSGGYFLEDIGLYRADNPHIWSSRIR
jgi:hypothetical protein